MRRLWKTLAAGVLGGLLSISAAHAQSPALEKPKLTLGVGGKPLLYYLPLTLAEQLGYFKDEGLTLEINDFGGGAKSLQALIGGSIDVVAGAYEHTLRMQEKGQDIVALIELGRYPGVVLAARADKAGQIKSVADLKGLKLGVTAPGSSTHLIAMYLLQKAGLSPMDVSVIGVGSGPSAVAAVMNGSVDALSHLDPVIAKLEQDKKIVTLVDTRTRAGAEAAFGGANPAAVVYVKTDFLAKNPNTAQALVNAFHKSLRWLEKATPEQVAATVPQDYWLGDKELYMRAFSATREIYSVTGEVSEASRRIALNFIAATDPTFKPEKIDLAKTFDGRFLAKAAGR